MYFNKFAVITFIALTMFTCKSAKTLPSGEANFNLTAKQLIRANVREAANFRTLQSKLKITYEEKDKTQTHTVTFRMKKDEIIWMSSAFAVIRAKITPDKISFYNKLDNTYFDGDFTYLSELLGTDLDFQKVQNILIGETLYNLKEGDYLLSTHENSYLLQPKEQDLLIEIFFLLNPSHFKVNSQQISQLEEGRMLQIDYLAYQKVDKQTLPKHIKCIALDGDSETFFDLEFKSVSLNEDFRFPFKIPSGFDQIELK